MNEHGYCDNCNFDFDGELIFETFMKTYNDRQRAISTAEMYGVTETKGRWNKKIGIYCMETDRTVLYRCPACSYEWNRE